MALYLTYRPRAFADVVGQDHIVTTLEKAVKLDQLAHAYLFAGPRGTGKTSIARILAREILTKGIADEKLKEQIGKEVEEGSIVDLIEIDAASTRGIDDIRDLIEKIQFPPVVAGAKVYIVDEVHMLTKEAFNALLKTLEEPPEYAYFILATTELHKVPDTIQSRCQRFPFRRVKDEDIVQRLQFIVDQERIKADRGAIRMIAAHATGSFRDAISLLDQLRSLPSIAPEDVKQRTGQTDEAIISEIFVAIDARDATKIPPLVERIENEGMPLEKVVQGMLGALRASMHGAIAQNESMDGYVRVLDLLLNCLRDMRHSPVPGLTLETSLLSLCMDRTAASPEPAARTTAAPAAKSKRHATTEEAPADEAPKEKQEEEPKPARTERGSIRSGGKSALIEAEDFTLENVRKHWPTVLKELKTPSVRMSLKNGTPKRVEGAKLFVAFSSSFHREKVADTQGGRAVEEILESIFKKSVRMECILDQEVAPLPEAKNTVNLAEAAEEVFGTT